MMPYNNAELIRMVDNNPAATELERELAQRLDEVMLEVKLIANHEGNLWQSSTVPSGQ